MKRQLFLVMLVLSFCWGGFARAADSEPESGKSRGSLVLYFANDLFYDTDKYYTNAVQIRYITPSLDLFPTVAPPEGRSAGPETQPPKVREYFMSFGAGQALFTPENTATTELQKNDRPYAAHLYGFAALHIKRPMTMDTAELSLGVVGPSALGEAAQNEIHRLRGFELAKGWRNQLHDEPALMLTWTRNYRLNEEAGAIGWGWDLLPYHSLTAGNVLTQAAVGAEVRYGWNLPGDFTTSVIRPGSGIDASATNPALQRKNDGWGWYVFAGAEGRAIAHTIFLDGNTWTDSHSIEKRPLVGEVSAGVALLISGMRITYQHVYMTKEFRAQKGGGQNYGSITLTIPF